MAVMSGAEFLLWATLAYLFWKRKLHRRFPAMASYLALHVAASPVFLALLYLQAQPWGRIFYPVYFFGFYGVYIASAIISVLRVDGSFSLGALGLFRPDEVRAGDLPLGAFWLRFSSAFSTISYSHRGVLIIPDIAFGLMRSVSILEICLLAFLCLSMNALRLPIRDMAFGIAFGFGLSGGQRSWSWLAGHQAEFIADRARSSSSTRLSCWLPLAMWVAYSRAARAGPQAHGGSGQLTIYRWNEIASALGHTGTQVAVVQPASSFFLTDVEKVVDKVLTRNLRESETKS